MADSPLPKANSVPPEITGWMAGEYRLGRKLGEGGFGTVYEAVHPLLKRRAAVKVLHRIAGSDSDSVLRFVAEARAVNQIKNRHIIDIFSFGKLTDGRHFYVMDLLEGEPLDRFIAREGRCSVENTVQLLRPIAEALDAAHAAGVVHRDLKPQNIYLVWDSTGETVPKLLDFGMAKLLGDSRVHTVSGTPLGTPLYMSPEQARGDVVDGRSDVYALGVLCHELLTGRLPITGENTIAVLMAHIIQAPPRVSEVCSELSPELDTPVLRMLEKKPEQRPSTATEALTDLARAAERAGAVVPSGPPRLSRPSPDSEFNREPSDETADTTLQPFSSGGGVTEPDQGREAMVRSASLAHKDRSRWPLWLLLVAAAAGATLLFSRGWHDSPIAASPSASALSRVAVPVVVPAAAAPSVAPSAVAASSAAPEPSAREVAPVKPAKRAPGLPAVRARIPSDLESPF
ncbi:MAG TPA: serine/threonine-protein kinase [Polyangiaceae bacterium]|nr:serine/threonine-protein kinase [Polyangiaceae bacterium]